MTFSWGASGAPAPPATVFARIVEASEDLSTARILAAAEPTAAAQIASLVIPAVPHGERRVVVLEVRESASPSAELLRYGVSRPFALVAGQTEAVLVELDLRAPPDPSGALSWTGARVGAEPLTPTAIVELELRTDTGVRAELSGFEAFPSSATRCFGLGAAIAGCEGTRSSTRACDAGRRCSTLSWDLNLGLDDDCGAASGSPHLPRDRCARRVYARFTDAAGFTSRAVAVDVVLDTRAPSLQASATRYAPRPDAVLSSVRVAARGSIASLTVVATEPVRSPPATLEARSPEGAVLRCERAEGSVHPLGAAYNCTIPGDVVDGRYAPSLTLVDLAGNRAALEGFDAPIVVLASTPTLAVDQAQLAYLRSPIGRSAPEPLGGAFTIPAGPYFALAPSDPWAPTERLAAEVFTLGARELVMLRFWADGQRRELLGSARPADDGAWPRAALTLAPRDAERVYVTGVDGAGNESAPVQVATTWFVAPSGRAPDGARSHPLSASGEAALPLARGPAITARDAAAAPDGRVLRARAERTWRGARAGAPLPRYNARMVYDGARDRVIMFGGVSVYTFAVDTLQEYTDIWEFDGRQWLNVTPAGEGPRGEGPLAYDAARGRTVLFEDGRTWLWDGARWTLASTTGPTARRHATMGYDAARRQVVLFGGRTDSLRLRDTWVWDGASWTRVFPAVSPPSGGAIMLYDDARERLELFTGDLGIVTWAWNGTTWTELTPAAGGPRIDLAQGYADEARGRRVFVGGVNVAESGALEAIGGWEWDGAAWSLSAVDEGPLFGTAVTYDRLRARPIGFSGREQAAYDVTSGPVARTWSRAGDAWIDVSPSLEGPAARRDQAMIYDEARERVLLHGGAVEGRALDELWAWDGLRWGLVTTSSSPGPRAGHGLVYDPARACAVLFGGGRDDTWELNGDAWSRSVAAMPRGFVPRTEHAMAYDEARGQVLLYGGRSATVTTARVPLEDTWSYAAGTWSSAPALSPPAGRFGHALVYDPRYGQVVTFGGEGAFVGTVEPRFAVFGFDGAGWSPVIVAGTAPPSRRSFAAAFDPTRRALVTFGGYQNLNGHSGYLDAWELDATGAWTEVTPLAGGPPSSGTPTMVFDRARGELVLFTSANTVGAPAETWIMTAPERPSIQLSAELPSELHASALTELRVLGACGGRGTRPGAELAAWDVARQRWSTLATTSASVERAAPLSATRTGSGAWSLLGPEHAVHLQCRAAGLSGERFAEVSVDHLELRARYRSE